jgi:hypothetical protein
MNCKKLVLTAFCAAAITPHGWSQPPVNRDPRVDVMKKKVIEHGTSQVVAESAPAEKPADRGKEQIERPSKAVAATSSPAATDNPTVEPGKVKWHKTLADAQAAAEKSGKAVLLFHMMGQLDKQFC